MKKIVNHRPVTFCALSAIAGIISAYCFRFGKTAIAITVCSLCLISFVFVLATDKRKFRSAVLVAVCMVIGVSFGLNFHRTVSEYESAGLEAKYYYVQGTVCEISENDNGYLLKNVSFYGAGTGKSEYSLFVYMSGGIEFDLGDEIRFYAEVKERSVFYEDRFSGESVLNGIKYTCTVNSKEVMVVGENQNLFLSIHKFLRNSLKKGLGGNEFSVAYALMLGNSDYMESELLDSFRKAGVAHIFAVSGLHIGFLAFVLSFLLKKLRFGRVAKVLITIVILAFYSGACGFSQSSVRAVIMCSTHTFCAQSGKKYDKYSSISLACLFILCYAPVSLFCVGFQLSFAVVLGIFVLSPFFGKVFVLAGRNLSASLSTVVSAQLFGAPLFMSSFGETSLTSVLFNLLLIPVVGIIFYFLFFGTIIGGIFHISAIALFPSEYALKAVIFLMNGTGGIVLTVSGIITGVFALSYYLCAFTAGGIFNTRKISKTIISVVLACVTVAGTAVTSVNYYNAEKICVSGSQDFSATMTSKGDFSCLVVSHTKYDVKQNKISRLAGRLRVNSVDFVIIENSSGGRSVDFIVGRLYGNIKFDKVYYCRDDYDRDAEIENLALKKSFPTIEFFAIPCGEEIKSDDNSFYFMAEGKAVTLKLGKMTVGVFSSFGDDDGNVGTAGNEKYSLCVAYDLCDYVKARYNPTKTISYLYSPWYEDAESQGTKLFVNGFASGIGLKNRPK